MREDASIEHGMPRAAPGPLRPRREEDDPQLPDRAQDEQADRRNESGLDREPATRQSCSSEREEGKRQVERDLDRQRPGRQDARPDRAGTVGLHQGEVGAEHMRVGERPRADAAARRMRRCAPEQEPTEQEHSPVGGQDP